MAGFHREKEWEGMAEIAAPDARRSSGLASTEIIGLSRFVLRGGLRRQRRNPVERRQRSQAIAPPLHN
jgi:hypothetical protein